MKKRAPRKAPDLPPPCSACRELRNWYRDPTTGGLERCPFCERGRRLKEGLGRKRKKYQRQPTFDGRMASTGDT